MSLYAGVFLLAAAIGSHAYSAARAPTTAECTALMDARDQLAPGVSLSAMQPMGGGGEGHRQTRLRAISEVVPSETLPQLERAMARVASARFELRCAEDRESGGVSGGLGFRISLPAFSADGRWMTLAWFRTAGVVGSEGYECAFERIGERWVRRDCELTYIS